MNKNRIIPKSLKKSLPFLQIVAKLSDINRKNVLKEVGGEKILYNALHEIAHNTLNGNFKLNRNQLKRLKPHTKTLKNLCVNSNRNCSKKRKKLIVQSGGYLQFLIPALASILPTIISKF